MNLQPPQRVRSKFDPHCFQGDWLEFDRYVKPGYPTLYPLDAKNVGVTYTVLSYNPLSVHLVNSYTGRSCLGCTTYNEIEGTASEHIADDPEEVDPVNCCLDVTFDVPAHPEGFYEILDFELGMGGVYTHLLVGSGAGDAYRWILVRDLDRVSSAVIKRFRRGFPW